MFEVANQPPPLEPYNLFASDAALREAVKREGAGWADKGLTRSAPRWASRKPSSSASTPTKIRRFCAASTATATASTRSSSIRPGTS